MTFYFVSCATTHYSIIFILLRDATLARYMVRLYLSVCPSVCLSQTGASSKQLNTHHHANNAAWQQRESDFVVPKI